MMLAVLLLPAGAAEARVRATLSGSPASMTRQNKVATALGYTFVEDSTEVRTLLAEGALVSIEGNADYDVLESVSYPFARPVVRLFIERLAAQYREATGEQLVVTSLTRPSAEQPRNAHQLSVHPAGIAIDLRISDRKKSRQWLEDVLLSLERQGLLDVTRERYPPHYHVALFPEEYRAHVEHLIGPEALTLALRPPAPEPEADPEAEPEADSVQAAPAATMAAALVVAERDDRPRPPVGLPLAALALVAFAFWYRARRSPAA